MAKYNFECDEIKACSLCPIAHYMEDEDGFTTKVICGLTNEILWDQETAKTNAYGRTMDPQYEEVDCDLTNQVHDNCPLKQIE